MAMVSDGVWFNLALAVSSLLATLVAGLCLHRLRALNQQNRDLARRLEQQLKVVNSSAVGMGRKLVELENQLLLADNPAQTHAPGASREPSDRVLDECLADAASLLAAGVDADEVARRCGISRAEAGLMKLMQVQVAKVSAA